MTKRLDEAVDRASQLPPVRQDQIADVIDRLLETDDIAGLLTAEQWDEIDLRLSRPARYATDEQVAAFFKAAGA